MGRENGVSRLFVSNFPFPLSLAPSFEMILFVSRTPSLYGPNNLLLFSGEKLTLFRSCPFSSLSTPVFLFLLKSNTSPEHPFTFRRLTYWMKIVLRRPTTQPLSGSLFLYSFLFCNDVNKGRIEPLYVNHQSYINNHISTINFSTLTDFTVPLFSVIPSYLIITRYITRLKIRSPSSTPWSFFWFGGYSTLPLRLLRRFDLLPAQSFFLLISWHILRRLSSSFSFWLLTKWSRSLYFQSPLELFSRSHPLPRTNYTWVLSDHLFLDLSHSIYWHLLFNSPLTFQFSQTRI